MSITRTKNTALAHLPGIFIGATAVLLLVFAAERSGLPVWWVELFVTTVLSLALLGVVWWAHSAVESIFVGRVILLSNAASATVLGLLLHAVLRLLPYSHHSRYWLASAVGLVLGTLFAHLWMKRSTTRQSALTVAGHSPQRPSASRWPFGLRATIGVAMVGSGFIVASLALPSLVQEAAAFFGISVQSAMVLALAMTTAAIGLGGWRASAAMVTALCALVMAGLFLGLFMGVLAFGALPLPGFSDDQTVQAIVALRKKWSIESDLYIETWPSLHSLLSVESMVILAQTAGVGAALALGLAPSIPIERRSVAGLAVLVALVLPLLMMALGGYAIEAAAKQLATTPVNRPVPGLMESIRLGMLSACGGFPDTPEALRKLCGVSPRDAVFFDLNMLKPLHGFLTGGAPVSLGYATTPSMIVRLIPMSLSLMGLMLGLWFMALGFGSHLVGNRYQAPGLASHRIGLIRISVLLGSIALGMVWQGNVLFIPSWGGTLLAAVSILAVACQVFAHWASKRTPRQAPQAA